MASFISASKMQEERCTVPEVKEEMVGLTVNASQEERSSSPSDKKPASVGKKPDSQYSKEEIMELRKNSTSKQGSGDGSAEDDAGGSRETENSVQVEKETTDTTLPGKKPKYQYTREQLMELRNHPLSRQKPLIPNNSSIFSSDAPPFHRNRAWDQEQWHHGSRHENAVEDDRGGRGDGPHENHKRRPGDPRERIRKEQDGIVLSPQRRNFNCGCFVVLSPQQQQQQNQQSSQHQQASTTRRPDSPLGKGEREVHREIAPNRRIGSGRIINRERDREYWVDYRVDREKEADGGDFGGFRGIRDRDREERAIRSERRPFGRDFDRDRDSGFGGGSNGGVNERGNVGNKGSSERNSGRSGRYGNDRRRYNDSRGEEEPEWFSGGPTSQHEVIELRGFEDIPEDSVAPNSGGHTSQRTKKQSLGSKSGQKSGGSKSGAASKKSPHGSGKTSPSQMSENAMMSGQPSDKDHSEKTSHPSPKISKPPSPAPASNKTVNYQDQRETNASGTSDFNLDDILKMDSLPGLLTNGSATEGPEGGSSRFCQWFRTETPPATAMMIMSSQQNQENTNASDTSNKAPGVGVNQGHDSRRSSLHDELLNNMINDSYFAPISPAASTNLGGGASTQDQDSASKSSLLLEMLHRGSHQQRQQRQQQPDSIAPGLIKPPSIKDLEITGKLHSVEELEARLRQNSAVGGSGHGGTTSRSFAPGVGRTRVKPDGADADTMASGHSDEDMAAFKKLLAQVSGGQAVPAANGVGQQIDLLQSLQMLSKKDPGSAHQPSNLTPQPGVGSSCVPTLNDPGILGGLLSGNAGLAPSPAQLGTGPSQQRPSPMQNVIPADVVMRLLQVQQQQNQQLQRHQQEWFTKLNAASHQQQPQQTAQQTMLMQPPPHSHIPHLHHGGQSQGLSQRVQSQLGPLSGIPNLPASPTPSTSLSPLPPELQMVINQSQPGRDLLQRPEAQNMMRGLGGTAPPHQTPMSSQQQQVAAAVAVAAAAAAAASPRAASPHSDFIHQIFLQQQQQQMRIPSPLNNAYCQQPRVLSPSIPVHLATASGPANNANQPLVTSPIAPNHPNTLSVQHAAGMPPHRVPSPGEMRVHTQQILHAALIKRKLEEQKENYRRRQEGQQMSHSPNPNTGKVEPSTPPAKHSPTPLAFTPTSVLRKMTAEKDPLASSEGSSMKADMKNQVSAENKSQQAHILALANQGQQHASNQWKNDNMVKVQQGRAIVKGGGNSMSNHYGSSLMDYQAQKMSHMMDNPSQASSNLLQNAGHGLPGNQYSMGSRPIKSIQRTGMVNSGAGGGMSANTVHPQFMKPPVMLLRPAGVNAAAATAARVQTLQNQVAGMQSRGASGGTGARMNSGGFPIHHGLDPSLQQLLLSQNSYVGMGGNMGGPIGMDRSQHRSQLGVKSGNSGSRSGSAQSTSPTNQLARWFSPELLAQARAGKLPDMPPVLTQRALSLEEVERIQQAATSVRN